jgi:hypothetical protein
MRITLDKIRYKLAFKLGCLSLASFPSLVLPSLWGRPIAYPIVGAPEEVHNMVIRFQVKKLSRDERTSLFCRSVCDEEREKKFLTF